MIRLPHLETNVTIACQNRCVACNHFVPLQVPHFKASMVEPVELERDLRNLGRIAHVDAWAAIGGEPTMHPALADLMRVARRSGIADRLEVWTNGQDFADLDHSFLDYTDTLVVSRYPGKVTDFELAVLTSVANSRGVKVDVKDESQYPNFSRLLDDSTSDPARTRRKFKACWFRTYSRVLDAGHFFMCCTSPFLGPLLLGRPVGADGLRVDESLTERALVAFLARTEPLEGCARCAGRNTAESRPITWREVRNPAEWVEASAGAA